MLDVTKQEPATKEPSGAQPPRQTPVEIVRNEDARSIIWLEDGTRLFVRWTVAKVHRLEDQRDEEGNPGYSIAFNTPIVTAKPKK